jgi:branched-chain amino acid transport system permease protein
MRLSVTGTALALLLALFALVPLGAAATDEPFYIDLFGRIMIYAIAVVSLDLILGYGGMMSFGHAAYLGIGAYAVAILSHYGINSGLIQWPVAAAASALFALAVGALSLRTAAVYFIMITLAFTQMLYFIGISLKMYGGDDGLSLRTRSELPTVDLNDPYAFYYLVFVLLAATLFLSRRLVASRFGLVLQGCMQNERRMRAVGYNTTRYKLAAFVISGMLCGLAGALLANQTEYVTPDYMNWTRSADLLIMLVLGGAGTPVGSLLGATVYLLLEEMLSSVTKHWQLIFGPFLLLVVLATQGGLYGLIAKMRSRWPRALDERHAAAVEGEKP